MLHNIFCEYFNNGLFISFFIMFTLLLSPILNRRYKATWRLAVWKFYILCLIVPISFILKKFKNLVFLNFPIDIMNLWNNHQNVNTPINFEIITQKNQSYTFMKDVAIGIDWIPLIWVIGLCIYAIYMAAGYLLFRRNLKMWGKPMDEDMQYELQETLFLNTQRKKHIQVYWCQNVANPFVTGIFRQLIVLPDKNYDPSDLKMIMEHELVHCMKRDLWWKGIFVVVLVLNWYNPVIHIMNIAFNRDIELCCDFAMVKNKDKEFIIRYSEVLLRSLKDAMDRRGALYVSLNNEKKAVEDRLKNIFDKKLILNRTILALTFILVFTTGSFAFVEGWAIDDFENQPGYQRLVEKAIAKYQEEETERLNPEGNILISSYKEKEARYTKEDGTVDYEKLLKDEEGIILDDWIAASDNFYEKKYAILNNSIEPHVLFNAVKATYYNGDEETWKLKKGNKVKIKIYADTDYYQSDGTLYLGFIENEVSKEIEKFDIKKEKEVEFNILETGEYKFYLECAASQPIIIKWIEISLE